MKTVKRIINPLVAILLLVTSQAFAQTTFEDSGTVESVNKVSRTIILDGNRMLVDGALQVRFENRQDHLLNIVVANSVISVSGIKNNSGTYIIKAATIHSLPASK